MVKQEKPSTSEYLSNLSHKLLLVTQFLFYTSFVLLFLGVIVLLAVNDFKFLAQGYYNILKALFFFAVVSLVLYLGAKYEKKKEEEIKVRKENFIKEIKEEIKVGRNTRKKHS
jgi:membrane protein implicated in regulation of membrane protease activity